MRDGTLLPPVRSLPAGAAELRSQVRGFLIRVIESAIRQTWSKVAAGR